MNSTDSVSATARIGISSGTVMRRNFCQPLAPSSSAASYRDGEIVCRPASSVIATNGMPRQMFATISDQRAGQGVPRKLI